MKFSAIITCTTECTVEVEAGDEKEAIHKMERGQFTAVALHDGGLDMCERFHDVDIVEESFGPDDPVEGEFMALDGPDLGDLPRNGMS